MTAVLTSRDVVKLVFEASSQPLLAVDDDLVILAANPAARGLLGDDDPIEKNLGALIPGLRRNAAEIGRPTAADILARSSGESDLQVERTGANVPIQIKGDPIAGPTETLWAVGLCDMTEFRASQEDILKSHQELEEFNRLAVGRELRMVELKHEVNALLAELGRDPRYEFQD